MVGWRQERTVEGREMWKKDRRDGIGGGNDEGPPSKSIAWMS